MGRNGFMGGFQGFDAFGKVRDTPRLELALTSDRPWRMSRSKPAPAPFVCRAAGVENLADEFSVTFISFSIIMASMLLEFIDYRRIHLEPSLEVDRSRGEKLVIELDISFPRVPCYREF